MPAPLKMSNWDLGRSRWYVRYGVAVSFVLLALLLQFLPPARQIPFAFFFAAVALSARICGFGAAIFATFLSAAMADFFEAATSAYGEISQLPSQTLRRLLGMRGKIRRLLGVKGK